MGICEGVGHVACSIKPKSQMGISYPLNLVHILILLGFAKKIKILAVREVTANLTSLSVKKYKGFDKLIKGIFFPTHFLYFAYLKIFLAKNESWGVNTVVQTVLLTPRSAKLKYVICQCHMHHMT